MTFFMQLKCAFCPRWSCHARYKIGNRTYYSYIGFVRTKCPKKQDKDPIFGYFKQVNNLLSKERLNRVKSRNTDNDNGKNEE